MILMVILPLLAILLGVAVHVINLAIIVFVFTRKWWWWLLVVPVAYYGGYYWAWGMNLKEVMDVQARYQAENTVAQTDYDEATSPLFFLAREAGNEHWPFVASYSLSEVFRQGRTVLQDVRQTALSKQACRRIKRQNETASVRDRAYGQPDDPVLPAGLCVLSEPFAVLPDHVVELTLQQTYNRGAGPIQRESIWTAEQDDVIIGTFKTAIATQMSAIPFVAIGCGMISYPAGLSCGIQPLFEMAYLDGIPSSVDRSRATDPVAIMLGIRKRTPAEIEQIRSKN